METRIWGGGLSSSFKHSHLLFPLPALSILGSDAVPSTCVQGGSGAPSPCSPTTPGAANNLNPWSPTSKQFSLSQEVRYKISESLSLVWVFSELSKGAGGPDLFSLRTRVLMNQDFPLTLKKKSLDCTKLSVCLPLSLAMEPFSAGFAAYSLLFLMPAPAFRFISRVTRGETAGCQPSFLVC